MIGIGLIFHCYVQNNYDDKVTIIQREKCDKNKLRRLFIDFLHNKVLILILSLSIKQFVVWLEGLGIPFKHLSAFLGCPFFPKKITVAYCFS